MGSAIRYGLYFVGVAAGAVIGHAWRKHRYVSVECKTAAQRDAAKERMAAAGFQQSADGDWKLPEEGTNA